MGFRIFEHLGWVEKHCTGMMKRARLTWPCSAQPAQTKGMVAACVASQCGPLKGPKVLEGPKSIDKPWIIMDCFPMKMVINHHQSMNRDS
jgi:hypothetical protein